MVGVIIYRGGGRDGDCDGVGDGASQVVRERSRGYEVMVGVVMGGSSANKVVVLEW